MGQELAKIVFLTKKDFFKKNQFLLNLALEPVRLFVACQQCYRATGDYATGWVDRPPS